ncbi:hypothetical protein [Flavobacterium sp.]|uniref:hypothetical protein n=1 Tax=Flavobacterium sp. TaxID=239 RepID=UPI00391D8BC5
MEPLVFQALQKNTLNAAEKYPTPPEKYFTKRVKTLRRGVVLFFIFGGGEEEFRELRKTL